ncbi:MAG TPA: glycoside hydrolase family 3 C-terminal domain-containing protein [Candidatus Binataceae bacterium]|nr:glycoside hydrolase family 3 C-terminal domain-containing protein [Candidatus Binataceae bacterium]
MTLEEKIEQMSGPSTPGSAIKGFFTVLVPLAGPANKRLGIPPFLSTGSSHGASYFTTAFPCAMARGASWDVDLEYRVHEAIGAEAAAVGANVLLAPCINLLRHPGWGRAQETYGEDTHHLTRMAVSAVKGAQQHVIAQPKHYALNSIERDRFKVDVQVDERTMREIYLPAFEAAVKEGKASSIMSAYNRVNGQYCGEHHRLIQEILKGEWKFDGFVMSDWAFGTRSTVAAANNGLDIEMPSPVFYGTRLLKAVREGIVRESVIDDAMRRIMRKKFEFGLFDRPPAIHVSAAARNRRLAREAAIKGTVLLKNEHQVLPFDSGSLRRMAVIGRYSASTRMGDLGSSAMAPLGAISPLDGIERRSKGVQILHASGRSIGTAARLARETDAAVVIASLTPIDEGEWIMTGVPFGGDRERLGLWRHDIRLIRAVAAANPRTVVVIQAGGAVTMADWIADVPAVMINWYPGCEGGNALAELLFGDANPSGKLPFTIPVSESQLYPIGSGKPAVRYGFYQGYRYFDRENRDPQFPFGFGLSYTHYRYDNITLSGAPLGTGGRATVTVDVTNSGSRAGDEIVQLYVSMADSTVERAPKDLRGFTRIHLDAGATGRANFTITPRDLAYYDVDSKRWRVESGTYSVKIGPSSRELPLCKTFEYAGDSSL